MTTEDLTRPPGNSNWVRNLVETLVAQREPLAEVAARAPKLVPQFWAGTTADRVEARMRAEGDAWQAVLDVHDEVVRRAEGHNTFVHELPHLWHPADRAERARYAQLWTGAAVDVREVLLRAAAALDSIAPQWARGPVDQAVTPIWGVAASSIEPVPDWPVQDPDPPYQHEQRRTSINGHVFEYRRRLVEEERLFEQLLVGPRSARVRWQH
ncbi:hypothetical protein [Actinokineospora globicatena]|uniref:hypothetical protein n=1 Tax=Actinokineospora globicatena TaxID=103729 RepID=UPI0020A402C2|nr:hypothetical protein [Actinokineospora globicatena]MCP2301394.1 hypothetical protein [Actinokineospora globicatena]GLW76967.1 hypothetical protein Aglo01_14490 [Actinokineospora globicatena]GLW83800.1 hypothetical protein Aglo02_14400 [Actinokineospora globicatena]